MTLGMALIAKDNTIVIASDKRVTEGTFALSAHGDIVEKIHKITDKSGLTLAGDAGTAVAIIEPFLKEISMELARRNVQEIPISETAEIFRNVAINFYTKWFKDMTMAEWVYNVKNEIIPYFRVLLAGFDMDDTGQLNKPKIIEMSSVKRFAPTAITTRFGVIGITSITQYLIYRFKTDEQDETGVAGLAAFCITETSSQDDSVGDQFQIASFSPNKNFLFYSDEELIKIKKRCAELKTEFQTALFKSPQTKEEA